MTEHGGILVFNAGASSIKFALFSQQLERILSGSVSGIGSGGLLTIGEERAECDVPDHASAVKALLAGLLRNGVRFDAIAGAAHRVVHGGRDLVAPCRVTPDVIAAIEACVPLAPLHNPHNLALIRAIAAIAPDLPQFATFDTAFHATNPDVALRYAIPASEDAKGIRRYGFHGISYSGLVERLPKLSGQPLPRRLLAMHLGNGASLCAIKDGMSVATTMGYSPLDGLTMGTRCGGIDGNAVLRLVEEHGIEGAARLLNHESGLKALGGTADMLALQRNVSAECCFAVEHFCYWGVRHAGSMISAMGGLDAVAFTGGIGENDVKIRARIVDALGWAGVYLDRAANIRGDLQLHIRLSPVTAWIVPADEEVTIARNALATGDAV
ncbi:MAG: acetate kinase [Hyphomicrobiales bacterium]|nr:MAG: acetate kinase [Hyphomicrobiales bacterium]